MLDTLKIADSLRKAGFGETQARAIADVQKQMAEEGGLATKTDTMRLEGQIRTLDIPVKSLLALNVAILVKLFLG